MRGINYTSIFYMKHSTHRLATLLLGVAHGILGQKAARLLRVAGQSIVIIDIVDSKALAVTVGPLKVVHKRPSEVATNVDTALYGGFDVIKVAREVIDTENIIESLLNGHRVLLRGIASVLRDNNFWVAISVRLDDDTTQTQLEMSYGIAKGFIYNASDTYNPDQKLLDSPRDNPEPVRVSNNSNRNTVLITSLYNVFEVEGVGGVCLGDVNGGVVVQTEEISGSLEHALLGSSKLGQQRTKTILENLWVVTKVDRVGIPAQHEKHVTLSGLDVYLRSNV
jgi:hypothetical protein